MVRKEISEDEKDCTGKKNLNAGFAEWGMKEREIRTQIPYDSGAYILDSCSGKLFGFGENGMRGFFIVTAIVGGRRMSEVEC